VISDCMLAGLNVAEETGTVPSHPIEVLRDAYGLGTGFSLSLTSTGEPRC
jgi:hypothetical protein